MDLLIALAAFLLVLVLGAFVIARHASRPSITRDVMRRMARPDAPTTDDITRDDPRKREGRPLLARLMQINLMQRFEEKMWQAGLYVPAVDVLLVILLLFGAGVTAGGAMWGDPMLALALGFGMSTLPMVYIRVRRQRRLRAFQAQLPYALDLIKSSLEAGHSLLRGLQVVVAEFADPIGSEFRSAIEQSRLGLPLPRALEEMLSRVPVDDLRLMVVAVRVQSEVGSSLAQIIGRLSEIVRTRQRIQQQIRALTAQSRMSGWVVGLLPVVLLGAFSIIQPSYTHTLFYDPAGRTILKIAAGLDTMAFLTIRRLLKVNF